MLRRLKFKPFTVTNCDWIPDVNGLFKESTKAVEFRLSALILLQGLHIDPVMSNANTTSRPVAALATVACAATFMLSMPKMRMRTVGTSASELTVTVVLLL